MRGKNIFIIVLVFLLGLSLSLNLSAQAGHGRGRLDGDVHDEAGNPLEGVKIVAKHLESKTIFTAESDKKGNWAVIELGTGRFRITAAKEGYRTVFYEMRISQFSGLNFPLSFTLTKNEAAELNTELNTELNMPANEDEGSVAFFEEGNELYQQKKYADAAAKFEEFIEKNPTVYQANINIGNCFLEMGEYDKAIEAYTKALEKLKEEKESIEGDKSAAAALAGIGQAYFKQGNMEKAGEYLKQAVDNFTKGEVLAFNMGEMFFRQREIDKAIEYFQLAIKIKENWAPPHRQLGYAYVNKGEYKLAVASLKKFVELAADDPQTENIKNLIPKLEELIKDK